MVVTVLKVGLKETEVLDSRQKYGSNKLTEVESEGFKKKLIKNLGDPMIKILCFALFINIIFTLMGETPWYESLGIAFAIVIATFVSTYSEYSNENAFKKLQEDASKIYCKVYREEEVKEIIIDDIVVNDLLILQSGDKIPADGILIEGHIKVDQAVLNGESKEATKLVQPPDYQTEDNQMDFYNEYKVFRGTVVCQGNAVMKVTSVGDNTAYGLIAKELQNDEERDSPLKVKLTKLAHDISKLGYYGGICIAFAFLLQKIIVHNNFNIQQIIIYCSNYMNLMHDIIQSIILGVVIIVMSVPEGLPLMIALVSALNMNKMLKDNVLVRKISGIETAGSLNILFSDKTGTITKGQLEVVNFIDGSGQSCRKFEEIEGKLADYVSLSLLHNTTAVISQDNGEKKVLGGNGTEKAALEFVCGDSCRVFNVEKVDNIPFDSAIKYSATEVKGEYNYTLIKGAPEKIIEKCQYFYDKNGVAQDFTDKNIIEDKISELAQKAIRVLAIAVSKDSIVDDQLPPNNDWIFIGLLGIRDDVREESIQAIKEVHAAGVQVVMITGDRQDTALAIAKEAGILTSQQDIVITSAELALLSDQEISTKLKNIKVIARALPTDKSRLVGIAQNLNLVVGMTGDGVNDSPALKKADVGFAMGSGTEVAKEASDIVILDDNFSSIDKAILYGRTIFNSIRKFIIFQLTINISAVLVSFIAPLMGMENPITITQILWINLIMDTFAALAFGGEPALRRYMSEKTKSREEDIVSQRMKQAIAVNALWIVALSLLILLTAIGQSLFRFAPNYEYLLTGYFTFFVFIAVFNAFNSRTDSINIFDNITKNQGFIQMIMLMLSIQIVMTYFGGHILRSYGLTFEEWLVIILLAATIIPIDMLRKKIAK